MYKYYKNNDDNDSRFDEITKDEYNKILKDFEEECELEHYKKDYTATTLSFEGMDIHITFNRHRQVIIQINKKGGEINA